MFELLFKPFKIKLLVVKKNGLNLHIIDLSIFILALSSRVAFSNVT